MNLGEIAPTIEALIALEPDELGLRLLPLLYGDGQQGRSVSLRGLMEHNFPYVYAGDRRAYKGGPYPGHAYEAGIAVTEAWFWLEGQGLLVPLIGLNNTPTPEARVLSRRGQALAREPRPALGARLLPKNTLHPAIREEVWSLFHRGKYDAAVFEAMKAVEIAVREAANLKPTDVGVDLMRKAFKPEGGPLADQKAPAAEREARANLFAGAIGSYKNPQSHRKVDLDNPDEAAEIIMLACHLLRIVTDRNSIFS